jgi:hypothetical protein
MSDNEKLAIAAHSASKSGVRWEDVKPEQKAYWMRVAAAVVSKDRELAGKTDYAGVNRQARVNARKRRGGLASKAATEGSRF